MYKRIFISAITLMSLLLLHSCSDNDNDSVSFGISESELVFTADGGTCTIDLSAGDDWTVSCDREWCLVTPTNGNGSTVCEVRVDSSYLYTERVAHLNFRCGSYSRQLTINQFGYEKVIKLDRSEVKVSDYADNGEMFEDIKVESNISYEVLVEYEDLSRTGWLKANKKQSAVQSVPRPGVVRLSYEMYMESDKDRIATVIFRQTDAKEGETPVESRLTFRQTHAQEIIPSREGDSLALLAVSRIMHVDTNWDTSQAMIYWNGVSMEPVTYYSAKLQKQVTEPRVTGVSFTMFNTEEGIPYQITFLDQLKVLSFTANANAHIKHIELGDYVSALKNLKTLSLVGYGISSLPSSMKEMTNLEELELSGNNFTKLPMDVITALDKHKLWYINFGNNRRRDVYARLFENASVRDTLGLHGALPEELFKLKNVCYIGLSYNYFEGSIPDMGYDASQYATLEEKIANNPVMPELEQLRINLNYLTGSIPDWILYHRNLRCWDPYTLVFNQYESSRDSNGRKTGFSNEPSLIEQACTLWSNDDEDDVFGVNARPFNRANTFDKTYKYETLFGGTVRR